MSCSYVKADLCPCFILRLLGVRACMLVLLGICAYI